MSTYKIAIVGATGLVGEELILCLKQNPKFNEAEIHLFASQNYPELGVKSLEEHWELIKSCNAIFNASSNEIAHIIKRRLLPSQIFIDNSSAFRMDKDVVLCVPEINGTEILNSYKNGARIFANPNCTAALLCMCLAPFKKWNPVRLIVTTYQAASGAGKKGLNELEKQIVDHKNIQAFSTEVFKYPLFLNIMSHNTPLRTHEPEGLNYNDEEWKLIQETRKILNLPSLKISATCMRVPVKRAHTESVSVDFELTPTLNELEKSLENMPGVKRMPTSEYGPFPMPLIAENKDEVFVGRLRRDAFLENTFHFILAGDQLRKGAALNALQILELIEKSNESHRSKT